MHVHGVWHKCGSQKTTWVASLHHVGSRDWTQVLPYAWQQSPSPAELFCQSQEISIFGMSKQQLHVFNQAYMTLKSRRNVSDISQGNSCLAGLDPEGWPLSTAWLKVRGGHCLWDFSCLFTQSLLFGDGSTWDTVLKGTGIVTYQDIVTESQWMKRQFWDASSFQRCGWILTL